MKKGILILAAMMSLTVYAQEKWTLKDCIDYAMQNSITLKQAKLDKQTATETRKQSQSALLPSLSASTNQSFGYRPWQSTSMATVTNGTVNNQVKKTYYNGTYGINASWTVWNGNQNHNQVKINQLAEEQAELTTQQSEGSYRGEQTEPRDQQEAGRAWPRDGRGGQDVEGRLGPTDSPARYWRI